ncbi:bifunctional 3-(3-hydroxy-phenyl)propionate/3-hydroxycinnamic acid hydroxylase [Rhodovulum sp. DZ06]|uniref:bifunctional 3-(3-hydroxy-phenyl)propionate/3-hydroxycinnamic acid hydroxylase MhpA n=1 Tax=Rhodovulum sp. DZ06 TaxID=3425126 RepID=UPI003D348789
MSTPDTPLHDVAIIGYGPTGAALAHLLSACGLSVLVLEREAAAWHLPRAVHFDDETMRILQWCGAAEEMEPLTHRSPGMKFVDGAGALLLDWPRPEGRGPLGWRASHRFHQPDLERVLRAAMSGRKTVTLRPRCDVFMLEDRGDHVELRWEDTSRGKIERARARYVVGCDGARSLVRRFIETGMEDLGFHERWLVVDVILNEDLPRLGDHSIQHCTPPRPSTYVRCPGKRRRWEITLLPGEDPAEMTRPENVWPLIADWITPGDARIERAAVYTFHSLVARDWRRGRLLLAGDSCHQTPPFMGQGLCAGMRDAADLYWKLATICRGDAPDALLGTYTADRRPNAVAYVQKAVDLGKLINASDPGAALRGAFLGPDGAPKMESIAPPLGPGLASGPLSGRLFGQPRLADGRLMDDAFAHRWVLVADAALAAEARIPPGLALLTAAEAPDLPDHLSRLGARAALLRPDRRVLDTAEDASGLAALAARALPDPIGAPAPLSKAI